MRQYKPQYKQLRRNTQPSGKRNIMYIIVILLLVIFLMTFGIQFILGVSGFIAGFNSDTVQSDDRSVDTNLLLAPDLFDIPDATNSATLTFTGRTANPGKVTIYVNDSRSKIITTTENELEFETKVTLTSGDNDIYAEYEDDKGRIKDSDVYKVTLLRDKPTLVVTSPNEGQIYDEAEIAVAGESDNDVTIKVNGKPIVSNSDGSFRHVITLDEGDNTVIVTATDIAGNSETVEVRVKYEKD